MEQTRTLLTLAVVSLLISTASSPQAGDDLKKPFRLKSGSEIIDVNTGHAAPYLFDFDGDGVRDLLVRAFGKGRLDFEGQL